MLDYADDSCALRRTFGPEDEPTWLEIRQYSPRQNYRLTVASAQYDRRRRQDPVGTFLPGGEEFRDRMAAFGEYGEGMDGVVWHQPIVSRGDFLDAEGLFDDKTYREAELQRREVVNSLQLGGVFNDVLILQTGKLSVPLAALDDCNADLMRHLGVVPFDELAIQPEPVDLMDWGSKLMHSYPTAMLRSGIEGQIVLRLIVEAAGRPSACLVQEPVVDAEYEDFVCGELLTKGRFNPGRNAEGDPIRSMHSLTIVYTLQ